MNEIKTLGIDLSKQVFEMHGVNEHDKVVLRKRVSRGNLMNVVANLPICLIGLEACGGAHYWARRFKQLGHEVKIMPPQYVKPYVKTNKTDRADAEAICEAVRRPTMRFVGIKNLEHQDIQSIHRIRQRLIKNRTALVNEIRGLLTEYGITIPKGIWNVFKHLPGIIEDCPGELTTMFRLELRELSEELFRLTEKITIYDKKVEALGKTNDVCNRLQSIPGVGPISATAVFAAVGDAKNFKNGRQLAAWLGLVPRQCSTGGKERLLGISKRGDRYIRMLLVHGARSHLQTIKNKHDKRSKWANRIAQSRGYNKACVALANKNARIIWKLMVTGESYKAA